MPEWCSLIAVFVLETIQIIKPYVRCGGGTRRDSTDWPHRIGARASRCSGGSSASWSRTFQGHILSDTTQVAPGFCLCNLLEDCTKQDTMLGFCNGHVESLCHKEGSVFMPSKASLSGQKNAAHCLWSMGNCLQMLAHVEDLHPCSYVHSERSQHEVVLQSFWGSSTSPQTRLLPSSAQQSRSPCSGQRRVGNLFEIIWASTVAIFGQVAFQRPALRNHTEVAAM